MQTPGPVHSRVPRLCSMGQRCPRVCSMNSSMPMTHSYRHHALIQHQQGSRPIGRTQAHKPQISHHRPGFVITQCLRQRVNGWSEQPCHPWRPPALMPGHKAWVGTSWGSHEAVGQPKTRCSCGDSSTSSSSHSKASHAGGQREQHKPTQDPDQATRSSSNSNSSSSSSNTSTTPSKTISTSTSTNTNTPQVPVTSQQPSPSSALAAAMGIPEQLAETWVRQAPGLMKKSPGALRAKCEYVAQRAGVSPADVALLVAAAPHLLLKSPANLVSRLQVASELFGTEDLASTCRLLQQQPQLLALNMDSLRAVRPHVLRELRSINDDANDAMDSSKSS